jgi:hypothetical protein
MACASALMILKQIQSRTQQNLHNLASSSIYLQQAPAILPKSPFMLLAAFLTEGWQTTQWSHHAYVLSWRKNWSPGGNAISNKIKFVSTRIKQHRNQIGFGLSPNFYIVLQKGESFNKHR